METFVLKTKFGKVKVVTDGDLLVEIRFVSGKTPESAAKTDFQKEAARQLKEYLAGKRHEIELPFLISGGEFKTRVLKELWHIEPGETITYSDLALRVGKPKAVRAVATVMSSNKLPLVLPCHRILPQSGGVGRYGGGAKLKRALLELERAAV